MTETGCPFFSRTPERAFVPEDFSADERLMVDRAEQFSRREVPLAERFGHQEEGLMPDLIRKAGALGFVGVDSPAEQFRPARAIEVSRSNVGGSRGSGYLSSAGLAPMIGAKKFRMASTASGTTSP